MTITISGLAYIIGDLFDIDSLLDNDKENVTREEIEKFRKLGLDKYSKCDKPLSSIYSLSILETFEKTGVKPAQIDAVISSTLTDSSPHDDMEMWKALNIVGLEQPALFGLGYQQSATFGGAIDLATALIESGKYKRVLVLLGAIRNIGARVEGGETVCSDGAASCIISKDKGEFQILSSTVISNPLKAAFFDKDLGQGVMIDESARLISACKQLYSDTGISADDISTMICTNANSAIYDIFSYYFSVNRNKIVSASLAKYAHVNMCDNVIDLQDSICSKRFTADENILLINWSRNVFSGSIIRYLG